MVFKDYCKRYYSEMIREGERRGREDEGGEGEDGQKRRRGAVIISLLYLCYIYMRY